MPITRFDGLPWFEAIVAKELARYQAAIGQELCETEQVFFQELDHALQAFEALRQKATSVEEIESIDLSYGRRVSRFCCYPTKRARPGLGYCNRGTGLLARRSAFCRASGATTCLVQRTRFRAEVFLLQARDLPRSLRPRRSVQRRRDRHPGIYQQRPNGASRQHASRGGLSSEQRVAALTILGP